MLNPLFLVSNEKTTHEVPSTLISKSIFLSNFSEQSIEIDARSEILEKILEFYKHYEKSDPEKVPKPLPSNNLQELIPPWDYAFIELDLSILLELTQACEYLKLQSLLELCCIKLTTIIRNKSPEDLSEIFNIKKEET